jgi:hypothetical protein
LHPDALLPSRPTRKLFGMTPVAIKSAANTNFNDDAMEKMPRQSDGEVGLARITMTAVTQEGQRRRPI